MTPLANVDDFFVVTKLDIFLLTLKIRYRFVGEATKRCRLLRYLATLNKLLSFLVSISMIHAVILF